MFYSLLDLLTPPVSSSSSASSEIQLPPSPVALKKNKSFSSIDSDDENNESTESTDSCSSTGDLKPSPILKKASRTTTYDEDDYDYDQEEEDQNLNMVKGKRKEGKGEEGDLDSEFSNLTISEKKQHASPAVTRLQGSTMMLPTFMFEGVNDNGKKILFIEQSLLSGTSSQDYKFDLVQPLYGNLHLVTTFHINEKKCPTTSSNLFRHVGNNEMDNYVGVNPGQEDNFLTNWASFRKAFLSNQFTSASRVLKKKELIYCDKIQLPFRVKDIFNTKIKHTTQTRHAMKRVAYTDGAGEACYLMKSYFVLTEERSKDEVDEYRGNNLLMVNTNNLSIDQME